MRVAKGRSVIFRGHYSNGENEHPAVITREWSGVNADTKDGVVGVNLTVFPDCSQPMVFSSVPMHHSREAADAVSATFCCFWPDIL